MLKIGHPRVEIEDDQVLLSHSLDQVLDLDVLFVQLNLHLL